MSRFRACLLASLLCLALAAGSARGEAAPNPPARSPAVRPAAKTPAGATAASPAQRIAWMSWGPDAFRKAIVRDRPILLNVVVSWSRYCRDMEATWSDPRIVALVNEGFVPIRVDADRRPDIRERYANPSWPSITLLLPNGVPFYALREGAKEPVRVSMGLMPPDRLAPVLEEALAFFKDKSKRAMLKKTVEEGQKAEAEPKLEPVALDPATPQKIFDTLRTNFDALHGSWTKSPKFPMPAPIEACLFDYSRDRDPRALEVAERALGAVLDGPLFDRAGGGIHRLSAGEDWSHPEYEKLLDRNVAFLDVLLSAHVLTGKRSYADGASAIVQYLETTLHRKGGGYYASQGFDPSSSDGGAYYRASAADRAGMKPPAVDSLVLVGWSAKAAAAQLRAARLLQKPEWVGPACESLDWLLDQAYRKGRGVVHGIDGNEKILDAYLEDQVLFGEGMLAAFELTGRKAYLEAAKDTAATALENLRDPASGLMGDLIPNPTAPLIPFRAARHPFEWNCRMARLLAHLFYLNPRDKTLKNGASGILEDFAGGYEKGPNSALYALAQSEYREGPLWVWVVGNPSIPGYAPLLSKAQEVPDLWKLVVTLDPADLTDAKSITLLGLTSLRPPALWFSKGTHTSKGSVFPQEVLSNYRALSDLLTEEKAKAAEREAEPASGPPAGATSAQPGASPEKPSAPSVSQPQGGGR